FAVAGQVIGVVITSSPGPTPSATRERCSAAVPDANARTCFASKYSAMRRSSSAARGPVVSQPERSVSATAAISSSPIAGGWKPSMVLRRVRDSDESFDIDRLESNHPLGAGDALERLFAAGPHSEDRTGPVRPAPELPEPMAGPAVDPNAPDALLGKSLLHPDHLAQLARRWDEKPDAGTADPGDRRQRRGRNLFAERGRECRPGQVDPEGDAAELRV